MTTVENVIDPAEVAEWFNAHVELGEVLETAGWTCSDDHDGQESWQAPGSTVDDLTVNADGTIEVTGTAAQSGADATKTPWTLYVRLHHHGDTKEALRIVHVHRANWAAGIRDEAQWAASFADIKHPDSEPKAFLTERGAVIPARLGAWIAAETELLVDADQKRIWRYSDGYYQPDGENWIKLRVRSLLGETFRRNHYEEILAWIRPGLAELPEKRPQNSLNLPNGILNLDTLDLLPHTPNIITTIRIPVPWNPLAVCPAVDQFLEQVLPADTVDLILEIFGYALWPTNPHAKAVLLVGPGGNGKSKLLVLLQALVGHANTSAVPLQSLAEDRFAGSDLYGKLANICGDLDARSIKQTDLFKQITGGDRIRTERKYAHQFSFTSYALPVFSANEPPLSADQSTAWFDRWLVIPMERRFRGEAGEDTLIGAKITRPVELEGLLVKAVHGLRALRARGRFVPPASVIEAGEAYRDRLDTARSFIAEECILLPSAWTPRPELYRRYREWCGDNGRHAVSSATFNDHLRRNHIELTETAREGKRGWAGVATKDMV